MRKKRPRARRVHGMRPESLVMSYGYHPEWSEGAIKPPLFQSSTFVFPSAEKGKEFFAYAYGLEERDPSQPMGLIYSRLNNPDLEILEARLNLWDEAEAGAVFASGMAAISTSLLALVPMGRSIVFSRPVYGGTDYLLEHLLPELGIVTREFSAGAPVHEVEALCAELAAAGTPCRMIFIETPANPTMVLSDIRALSDLGRTYGALVAVDNTFLGPLFQRPLDHGADLVLYSATKYLGGHSDLLAGVSLGSAELVERLKFYRTILGTMLDPHSAWLLLRSLDTAKLRMTCASKNAERVASWLASHPHVTELRFPGLLEDGLQREIYDRQCLGPGAMLSFEIVDAGEPEVFRFLNALELVKLAVSLGGTESLVEHPATMTHADVPRDEQEAVGINPRLVRLSVGIEHPDDIILDLQRALAVLDEPEQGSRARGDLTAASGISATS